MVRDCPVPYSCPIAGVPPNGPARLSITTCPRRSPSPDVLNGDGRGEHIPPGRRKDRFVPFGQGSSMRGLRINLRAGIVGHQEVRMVEWGDLMVDVDRNTELIDSKGVQVQELLSEGASPSVLAVVESEEAGRRRRPRSGIPAWRLAPSRSAPGHLTERPRCPGPGARAGRNSTAPRHESRAARRLGSGERHRPPAKQSDVCGLHDGGF